MHYCNKTLTKYVGLYPIEYTGDGLHTLKSIPFKYITILNHTYTVMKCSPE